MSEPWQSREYDFILHRLLNGVESVLDGPELYPGAVADALGDLGEILPPAIDATTGQQVGIDAKPLFAAVTTLISYLLAYASASHGVAPHDVLEAARQAFLPPT